ncbi:MAG: hypothetical protein WCF85_09430 [Rhodospirillaceae bacterium]
MMRSVGYGMAVLAFVVAGTVTATPGAAQTVPPVDALREQFGRELPLLWRLDSFTLVPAASLATAPAEIKDAAAKETPANPAEKPVIQPFTAVVSLGTATYTVDSQRGPFTLLRPVAEQGTRKTLSGLAKSVQRDGRWTTRFGIQNNFALDTIGQPLDRFPGRTIVTGTPDATRLLAELDQSARQQTEAEAEIQRQLQEGLDRQMAAIRAEAQRIAADRAVIDQRAAALADLKRQLLEGDRTVRIATLEAALNGKDTALRAMAYSTALTGRDPVVANLALRSFLAQKKSLPVQLFATREVKDSESVLHNLGPLTLTIDRFDPLSGNLEGKMGAPGYSIALPGSAFGYLAQTELNVNTYGCTLQLRLSDVETLDGMFRCQTLPTLIARITLD